MPLLTFQLSVGARGWLHAGWLGGYYPDDLPEDWRLDYYANEFRQVLVPADYWRWAGVEQTEEWADQVDDGFRFFIEAPDDVEEDRFGDFLSTLEPLRDHIGGVIGSATIPGNNGIKTFHPATGDAPNATAAAWSGTPDELSAAPPAGLVRLSASGTHSPLELRGWCEALKAPPGDDSEVMLFLDGAPPPIGDLHTLKQLAELMC